MTTYENLSLENRDGCLWLTLDRADKANALTVGMMEGAAATLARMRRRSTAVRAILLTGAGDKRFRAGADVREKPADGDVAAHRKRRGAALVRAAQRRHGLPQAGGRGAQRHRERRRRDARAGVPTRASRSRSAEISLPEINLGMATFPGAAIVMHVGGLALATDLVQTGRRMPAAEAFARGLLTSVVPRAELRRRSAARRGGVRRRRMRARSRRTSAWLNRR